MSGRALVIAGDNRRRRPIGCERGSREPISAYGASRTTVYRSYTTDSLRIVYKRARSRETLAYVRGIYRRRV